jgi:hypothetical protein
MATRAKQAATRPKQTESDVLADARQALAKGRKYLKQFKKADEEKKIKLVDEKRLNAFEQLIKSTESAVAGQPVRHRAVKSATRDEVGQRKKVFDSVTSIREDVKLAFPKDKPLAQAFASGMRISEKSTPQLLLAAGGILAAYSDKEHPAYRAAALDAGVTPKRIDELMSQRDALATADTTQNTQVSTRKSQTVDKKTVLLATRQETAFIRKVAARVFKSQPKVIAEFKSTITRYTPKKRQKPEQPPK